MSERGVAFIHQAAADDTESSALRLLGCAGFGSMFSMRMCDAMLPELGRSFEVAPATVAGSISAFAIAYGVMQLVVGPLGDRCGKARVVSIAALAGSLAMLTLGRAAMGAAAAGVIPLTMAWIGDTVVWERRQAVLAQLLGYTVIGMMVGAWAGGVLSEAVGWCWAFVAVGVYLIGAAVSIARQPPGRPVAAGLLGAARRLYSRTARYLLQRMPRHHLATAGGALLCAASLVLATMPQWWWGLPACWIAGLGFYMLHGTLQASATQLSDTAWGTAVSLFACVLFLGQSIGVSVMARAFASDVLEQAVSLSGIALLVFAAVFGACLRAAA